MLDGSLESQCSSIRLNWTFSLSITVQEPGSYEAKCVQLGCFRSVSVVSSCSHSNLTWTGSSPRTIDTELTDGEDRIPLRSLVLTQHRSVTDRETDGQTDGFAVAYTALAALQSCSFAGAVTSSGQTLSVTGYKTTQLVHIM